MAATKKSTRRMGAVDTETARKIWLAGVGAYGRAFDTAREQLGKMNHDANEYFEELVARGEKVEDQVRDQLEGMEPIQKATKRAEQMTARAEKAAEAQREFIETRMADLRESLEMPMGILALSRKVRQLTADVDALKDEVRTLKATKARATTAKRTTKKAAAKKATKKNAKKAAKKTAKRAPKKAAK
jgi:NADH-quinone oxidoreductase subunit E